MDWDQNSFGPGVGTDRMQCLLIKGPWTGLLLGACAMISVPQPLNTAANRTLTPRSRRLVVPSVGRVVAFSSWTGWCSSTFALLPHTKLGKCILPHANAANLLHSITLAQGKGPPSQICLPILCNPKTQLSTASFLIFKPASLHAPTTPTVT